MVDEKDHKCKEHFVAEGFTLEWGERGLLMRAIDYHATELLVDWDRVLDMAEYALGDSLMERIGRNPVIDIRETTAGSDGPTEKPGDSLQESEVIRALAEDTCQRITRKTIAQLQRMTDALHSGDDSGLRDAWDEICVQVQDRVSFFWEAYDSTVKSFLNRCVSELRSFECEAIWLQTREGEDWSCEPEDERDPDPVVPDDVVEYVASDYVFRAASNWSNPRVRAYIERCLSRLTHQCH